VGANLFPAYLDNVAGIRPSVILETRLNCFVLRCSRSAIINDGRRDINPFDAGIIHFLSRFAHRSWFADSLISLISDNILIKGGLITAVLWWLWFREGQTKTRDREFILCGIGISVGALLAARALAALLPYRERPMHNPALHFRVPFGVDEGALINWSSFPSDNAVLYFSLATCIYFLSRRVGSLALGYAFFGVALPRVYMGLHYPTDVVAGALFGAGLACLSHIQSVRALLTRSLMRWLDRSPAFFYPCFYLACFLTATNFEPVRKICVFFWNIARHAIHHHLH
jgi:undecaprenyl-diphosphatase